MQPEPEPDAIKEAVLHQLDDEGRWSPLVLSLSLEALRAFALEEGGRKAAMPRLTHAIEAVRDVVPAAALGGAAVFKVLTSRETLTLRAPSAEEARSWRALIRRALDAYLEGDEGGAPPGSVHRLVRHSLKGEGVLLGHLCNVPTEKGLDAQNFKCAGCPNLIGVSRGKARLCEFSGQYYCDSCHHGDSTIIPSRMVHNWDITPREISRRALKLLSRIEHEPLLNLDLLNPDLCAHAEPVAVANGLRQRLRLLGEYLLTCRSLAIRKIRDRIHPRAYLLESSHWYSVMDLRQLVDGQYEAFLLSLIQFASSHVKNCDLCTQRGFICQICHADDIIFPFQFDTTTRCSECKTVFHSACKAAAPSCPRCLRLQRYLERHLQD